MSENCLQSFNLKQAYELCDKIIKNRDFQCLIDLNKQCEFYYYEKVLSETTCFLDEIFDGIAVEEDALFLLLYYIYYILLDAKERNIFVFLQKMILFKNLHLFQRYKNDPRKDEIKEKTFSYKEEHEQKCYDCILFILEKYTKTKILNRDITIDDFNEFIYELQDADFQRVYDDCFLTCMIAIGVLDYKKILSDLSYDILIQTINDASNTILDKFFNDSFNKDINSIEDIVIQDTADELRF